MGIWGRGGRGRGGEGREACPLSTQPAVRQLPSVRGSDDADSDLLTFLLVAAEV